MVRIGVLALVCGCRLHFDPIGGADDAAGGISDARKTDGASDGVPVTACSFAMPIQVGTRLAVNTCTGRDLVDGCGPAGREEVVIDFVPPATGGYNVRAFDPGTTNVTVSTGRVDMPCSGTTGCSGILSTTFTAGQHYYFAFEGNTVACAPIEVLID